MAVGKKAKGVFAYMNEIKELLGLKCNATTIDEFLKNANLETCLKVKAAYHIA